MVALASAGMLSGKVLDAGCGTGEHAILAARTGAWALGIDISRRAIELAAAKAAEAEVEATFEVLDARRAETLGESFDVVIDSGLFHVFDDDDRLAYTRALEAVLRPGGHLHLMCFSERQAGDWGPRRVTEGELRQTFAAGWRIESLRRDHFDINPGLGTDKAEAWRADVVRLTEMRQDLRRRGGGRAVPARRP